jgi:CubicO group peptidase (beta-lactamase class C family)
MENARLAAKKVLLVAVVLAFILLSFGFTKRDNLQRMWNIYTFFDEGERIENFRRLDQIMPGRAIRHAEPAFHFQGNEKELNPAYVFNGESKKVNDFLAETVTTGFLVVKDDTIVEERYFQGGAEDSLFTSMSVAKSFISALVGIAIDEGLITGVDRPITDYVPKLKGSGYDGVPIKHVLQMSSGVRFNEEYDNQFSDINTMFLKIFGFGQPVDNYMANLKPEFPSGTTSYYRSCDTQALGMLVSAVTGKSVSAYLEEKIWSKIGMEHDAFWCTDMSGTEIAFAFLNATLRDYARFGRLYLHNGDWNGNRIISENWVRESVTPDNPNLQPGPKPENYEKSFGKFGYQYQWWIPENPDGEFMANGVWGQYIYVSQKENLIIVKTSVDPHFADNNFEHDDETVAVCREIAQQLRNADAPETTPL